MVAAYHTISHHRLALLRSPLPPNSPLPSFPSPLLSLSPCQSTGTEAANTQVVASLEKRSVALRLTIEMVRLSPAEHMPIACSQVGTPLTITLTPTHNTNPPTLILMKQDIHPMTHLLLTPCHNLHLLSCFAYCFAFLHSGGGTMSTCLSCESETHFASTGRIYFASHGARRRCHSLSIHHTHIDTL